MNFRGITVLVVNGSDNLKINGNNASNLYVFQTGQNTVPRHVHDVCSFEVLSAFFFCFFSHQLLNDRRVLLDLVLDTWYSVLVQKPWEPPLPPVIY